MKHRSQKVAGFLTFLLSLALAGCGSSTPPNSCTGIMQPPMAGASGNSCVAPEYLYAAGSGQVSSFTINRSTGALSAGSFTAGPSSVGVVVDPVEKFLYVSDLANGGVYAYSANSANGALTSISGSPFPVGATSSGSRGMAITPSGKFLYVTDANGSVVGFRINSDGTLTSTGAPSQAGALTEAVAVNPSGTYLYATNLGDALGSISGFRIDSATGILTPVPGSPFPTVVSSGPFGVVISPSGKYLYAALTNADQIAAFTIDGPTGTLSHIPGSFLTGNGPTVLAMASGQFLYAMNSFDGTISGFTINASGDLTALSGSPFAAGTASGGLALEASGKFLYAADPTAATVKAFTVESNGALTPFVGSGFAAGAPPLVLAVFSP